ncbi:MAG: type II secretion system F family protein [Planctomycetota bacterium]
MKIAYSAYNAAGEQVSGCIDAGSLEEGTEKLAREGLFVVEASEASGNADRAERANPGRSRRQNPKQIALFARELSVLISTGTPIAEAIESLEKQATNEQWREVVASLRRSLEEGESFSSALQRRSDVFDALFVSLVAAGESAGQLDDMLKRLAVLTRRAAQIRSGVIGAMAYPVLLTGICLLVMILMLGVVLPRFSGLFETLDTPLPGTTRVLVMISETMTGAWFVIVPALAIAVVGMVWWLRTPQGQRGLQGLVLAMPKVGEIVRSFGTAQTARLLGTLLSAKVPMIEAIELTRQATGHYRFIELLDRAEETVVKGEPISAVMLGSDVFLPSAAQAIRNGEQTGRLAEVLTHIADYLDEENQSTVKALSSLLEPLIMLVLGGLVAFVAVSMFLPLFDLTASAGGG